MLGMYRHGLAAKVLASIEMPDHRDFPQHHPALRDWEVTGGTEQVRASPWPGEVAVFHLDGPRGKHCDYRLPIFWLQQINVCIYAKIWLLMTNEWWLMQYKQADWKGTIIWIKVSYRNAHARSLQDAKVIIVSGALRIFIKHHICLDLCGCADKPTELRLVALRYGRVALRTFAREQVDGDRRGSGHGGWTWVNSKWKRNRKHSTLVHSK